MAIGNVPLRFPVNAFPKFFPAQAKRTRPSLKSVDRNVSFTALNRPNVVAVYVGDLSKAFLGQLFGFARTTKNAPNNLTDGRSFRHLETVGLRPLSVHTL